MSLQIRRYSPDLASEWNSFVQKSKNGTFMFDRGFMEYHADRFQDHSLVAHNGAEIVALLPANIADSILVSHGGLTFGGWVVGSAMRARMMLDLMSLLQAFLAEQSEAEKVVYKCIPRIYHQQPAEEDLYALFRIGARLIRRDIATALIPAERLPLTKSRKHAISSARKSGVRCEESDDLECYHELLSEVLSRHGAIPVHSASELRLLKTRFPQNIRFFASFLGDRMVAGALVFDSGRVAHTQYLASSAEGRETGALDAVLDWLAADVFRERDYLSFGTSTESEGQRLNEGLIFQKEGFGGRSFVHDFYEFDVRR